MSQMFKYGIGRKRKRKGGLATAHAEAPVGSMPGDVTRYMCAGAYLDERFADQVVEDVLADEISAVVPSPGVDLVAVAHHCLAAQEIHFHRDRRLAGAVGIVALFAPLWVVFVPVLTLIAGLASRARPSLATRGQHQPDKGALVRAGLVVGAVALFIFVSFVGVSASTRHQFGVVSWLLGAYLSGLPAALASVGAAVFAYATVARHDLATDEILRTSMTREAFARGPLPPAPPRKWIVGRLAAVKEAQDGNVTVYSGYAPFIGYAKASSSWRLAVPLLPDENPSGKDSRPATPKAFTVTELVEHVRERLGAIAAGDGADGAAEADKEVFGSLIIEDRVFASGMTVGDDDRFMTATNLAPAARLSPKVVREIMLHPTGTVRHYLAVHVPLWGGDVVPSVFLHFSTAGETLHLNLDNHVLGTVAADYHVVDLLRGPLSPEGRRGVLVAAFFRTSAAFFGAPFRARRYAHFEAWHEKRMRHELMAMEQDPAFDYGARLSMREMALSPTYQNYFQFIDANRITSMIERHALAVIRKFLESHGFDTTEFRSQQQTILNHGLIQQGGMSIVGNQAIGVRANATQNITGNSDGAAVDFSGQ